MIDRNVQLHGGQRPCKGGVGIAIDQEAVRLLGEEDLFNPRQHGAGHPAMSPALNAQIIVRLRNAQLLKKDTGHIRVVVLSRVQQNLVVLLAQNAGDYCRFDKLWPRSDYCYNLHCCITFL